MSFKNLSGVEAKHPVFDEAYDLGNAKKILVNGEEQKYVSDDILDGLDVKDLSATIGPESEDGSVVLTGHNGSDKIEFFF